MTNLKATLARDIDDVLAWVYGEVHADTHFGMQVTGGNYMKVQHAKTVALKEALKGISE